MKLSIIIPVYNEERTIKILLQRIDKVSLALKKEIIIVDDGSTDKTRDILQLEKNYTLITHKKNLGKGAAVRTGLSAASGDIILIQDADLEYAPEDYPLILQPLLTDTADFVFGSRRLKKENKRGKLSYTLGGIFLTKLFNFLFKTSFTDIYAGTKACKKQMLPFIIFNKNRFEFESEMIANLCKKNIIIKEVPISYAPRFFGKKIRWIDGVRHGFTIITQRCKHS